MRCCVLCAFLLIALTGLAQNVSVLQFPPKSTPAQLKSACAFVMKEGNPVGTGFFIAAPEETRTYAYFVTAKHVVNDQHMFDGADSSLKLKLNVHGENKSTNVNVRLALKGPRPWFEHENPAVDLAVFPVLFFWRNTNLDVLTLDYLNSPRLSVPHNLGPVPSWFCGALNYATQANRKMFDVQPGHEVMTLGLVPTIYYNNIVPNAPNIVLYRKGCISALPDQELRSGGGAAKTIILDCPVVHGNSGSPVFVYIPERHSGTGQLINNPHLLGVLSSMVISERPGIIVPGTHTDSGLHFLENSGLSQAVPVDYLVDILEGPAARTYVENMRSIEERKKKFFEGIAIHQNKVNTLRGEVGKMKLEIQSFPSNAVPLTVFNTYKCKVDELGKAVAEWGAYVKEVNQVLGEYFSR